MPKSTLTWYKSKAKRIVMILKGFKQQFLADELNTTQQNISYAFKSDEFQRNLETCLQLLNIAGYEVKEKGEEL